MFVEYSAEAGIKLRQAVAKLTADVAEIEGFGELAYRRGEEVRMRVGPGRLLAKEVVVALGPAHMSRRGPVLPVRWRATGAEVLFPSLEGEIILEEVAENRTRLVLQATYRPPLGFVGDLVDRLLLTRVAKATVKDWLDRMVDWLEQDSSADRDSDLDNRARTGE